jgi:glycosyltransferase involved in cell wall biosynthesis
MSGSGAAVTVVIPVWDGYVGFLPDAVESVRRNSPDIPIVVVDNASSNAIVDVPGFELVRSRERLSVGAARNLGLERVATEYVAFLDVDDMLLEGSLEFLRARMEADPGLTVSGASILDEETGERHRAPRRFVSQLVRWPRLFALLDSIWSLLPIQGCALLRTSHVRQAGGYADADLGEDWVLTVSLAWRGRVELSDQLGLYYRAGEDSTRRRSRKAGELRGSARRVRERLRRDPEVPAWARFLLPAIALLQLAAIHLARPVYLALRARTRRPHSNIR